VSAVNASLCQQGNAIKAGGLCATSAGVPPNAEQTQFIHSQAQMLVEMGRSVEERGEWSVHEMKLGMGGESG